MNNPERRPDYKGFPMSMMSKWGQQQTELDSWQVCRAEVKQSPYGDYYEFTGAVYPPLKSGRNKSKPNYKKPEEGSKKTFQLTIGDAAEFIRDYEIKYSTCIDCSGTGRVWAGWSEKDGHRYKDECKRCGSVASGDQLNLLEITQ